MDNNYFFIDGSTLLADIKRLRNERVEFRERKLVVMALVNDFWRGQLRQYHGGTYRRFTFYFARGDDRLERDVVTPASSTPDAAEDVRIEYCGKPVKEVRLAQEWLEQNRAPDHVRDCIYRSEKGVDTQICCDALQLAGLGRLDRLFLFTNDSDFVPLCRTLRQLGVNVNLLRLQATGVNKELAAECDGFHIIKSLDSCFTPSPATPEAPPLSLTPRNR